MEIGTANVDASQAFGSITIGIRVKGLRRAKVRTALAIMIFKLGGWVSPTEVEVSID